MAQPHKFNPEQLAKEAIAASPEVTMEAKAPEPVAAKAAPMPAMEVSSADQSDGEAIAYGLNAAHNEFLGEDLNAPLVDAVGRVMAGVFSQLRASGVSPTMRLTLLGLGILPAVAVVGLRFWQKMKEGPKGA